MFVCVFRGSRPLVRSIGENVGLSGFAIVSCNFAVVFITG